MDIPGAAAAAGDADLRERADREMERLQEELRKEVQVRVTEIGTLRRKLAVTVPAKVIADHLTRNFDELRQDAVVPGFRKGRAPLALVQKRFGSDVRDSLKTSVIGQSYVAAVEKEKLEVLGDPLFEVASEEGVKLISVDEALSHITLPEAADLRYVCEVEIKPVFELPKLTGIPVRTPKVEVTPADVETAIERQRKIRGRYEPVTDGAASEAEDVLVADVTLSAGGKTVKTESGVQLGVRPARLDGIPVPDLGETLRGARPGDRRTAACDIPDDYERPDLRGQKGSFEFQIRELRRLVPMPLQDLASQVGAESEQQLREFVREDLEGERARMVRSARKEQVLDYLVEKTAIELPQALSAKQVDRAVVRRVIELQRMGIPDSEIEARIDQLRTSATKEAIRDLKLQFILEKTCDELGVTVTDEEVNTEISRIARRYHRRFDRVRDDLLRRGLLEQLAEQIRHDKCAENLLEDAQEAPAADGAR
jgi:trigger factor